MAFCAPVLFHSIGFGLNGALIGAVILGVVNLVLLTKLFDLKEFWTHGTYLLAHVKEN